MKKYEKPYLEAENIELVDICVSSTDTGNVDEEDENV